LCVPEGGVPAVGHRLIAALKRLGVRPGVSELERVYHIREMLEAVEEADCRRSDASNESPDSGKTNANPKDRPRLRAVRREPRLVAAKRRGFRLTSIYEAYDWIRERWIQYRWIQDRLQWRQSFPLPTGKSEQTRREGLQRSRAPRVRRIIEAVVSLLRIGV